MISGTAPRTRYGDKTAADDRSFEARPGTVTGFLGPNAAGKSTIMRLDLDRGGGGAVSLLASVFATLFTRRDA